MKYAVLLLALAIVANANLPKEEYLYQPASEKKPVIDGYNAPARIDVHGSCDIFLWGNFLYWHASEEGLEYGSAEELSFTPNRQTLLSPKFKYKPGFQVGIGFAGRDDWDLKFWYTWYRNNVRTTNQTPDGDRMQPFWFDTTANASFMRSRWKLSLQMLDAEIGREYFAGKNLSFRPSFAVTSMWMLQRFRVVTEIIALANERKQSLNKARSWGIGPKLGIATKWMLGRHLDIFAKGYAASIYTKYKIKHESQDLSTSGSDFTSTLRKKISWLRPYLDLSTGIDFGFYFSDYRFHLSFYAAYEFQLFWNQNVMRQLFDETQTRHHHAYGDLFLHGATTGLRFDF